MEILLCRHGETDANVQARIHLRGDGAGLNDVGRSQAVRLTRVAAEHEVRALFTSAEERAIETARILGKPLQLEPTVVEGFRERDWGDWNGEPWDVVELRLRAMNLRERYTFVPPHGESWQQMERRLWQALGATVRSTTGNVMIITHAGALRALVPLLKHEELGRSLGYTFANASVTSFIFTPPDTYKPLLVNSTVHLQ